MAQITKESHEKKILIYGHKKLKIMVEKKSDQISIKHKEEGNKKFLKSDFFNALVSYNKVKFLPKLNFINLEKLILGDLLC